MLKDFSAISAISYISTFATALATENQVKRKISVVSPTSRRADSF